MSEIPAEAPATDAPGEKVYICPACGTRYDAPTMCANGHAPTATVEYDRATIAAADAGDAQAIAAVNETALAAGNTAGVVPAEATPAAPEVPAPVAAEAVPAPAPVAAEPVAAAPVVAEPVAAEPVVEAAPVVDAPASGDVAAIIANAEAAIEDAAAALRAAKTALGL